MQSPPLFRSDAGEVACAQHAPPKWSVRWTAEGWQPVGLGDGSAEMRCHECARRKGHRNSPPDSVPFVLNVDDTPAQLYLRDRILREHGFSVVNVTTGEEALETATRLRPHVILLDVNLPDADGRDICRRLKSDPELQGMRIVLISSSLAGHVNQLESVRWGGADAFVLEPVAPEVLVSLIRRTLGRAA